ncbi:MAG: mechanosensitive ion channel protein [Gemmatimonadota bacterium]|nr:MAG: mechanosensitive ion channel protein [Gemmatimonadota bacterium]
MDSVKLEEVVTQGVQLLTLYGMRVIGAIIILVAGRILSRFLGRTVDRAMTRGKVDEALKRFAVSIVRAAIMIFAIIAALNKFGVETTSFVAVLGAAGLAVGLALQGSLSNFAAGVLILVFKPFKIGDVVDTAGVKGKIVDVGILTTTMNTPDNQKIIIPNASVMGGTITNVNAYDTRRVDLTAGISYHDDIGKAKDLLAGILADHPAVLKEPAPVVEVVALADSSVNFVVRPWVKTADYWTVYFEVTRAIKEKMDAAGISIPFPQRDVHLHQAN